MAEMKAFDFLLMGGPIMIPILLVSIFSVAIILERFAYLSKITVKSPEQFQNEIIQLVQSNKIKAAIELCSNSASPLGKILSAGLLHFGSSSEQIKQAMKETSLLEIAKLENPLNPLIVMTNISPLLGLVGTITGLMNLLQIMQHRSMNLSPITAADLTAGTAQALITTLAGLMAAIVTYLFYNYFQHRTNLLITQMEEGSIIFLHFLSGITPLTTESENTTTHEPE